MTMESSENYVEGHLALANEALDDAKFLLGGDRLRACINRAYYAMFHTAHAAFVAFDINTPKTHSGTINMFGRHFILTERLGRQFGRDLQNVYNLRKRNDYEVYTSVDEDQVSEIVARAEAFVEEIKRLIEEKES